MLVLSIMWRNEEVSRKGRILWFPLASLSSAVQANISPSSHRVYSLMGLGQFLSILPNGLCGAALYFLLSALLHFITGVFTAFLPAAIKYHTIRISRPNTVAGLRGWSHCIYSQEAESKSQAECGSNTSRLAAVTHDMQQSSTS